MLTGVTGFLGIHILDSFMKHENGKVYCIIRGKNKVSAKDRLIQKLHYYFNDEYDNDVGNRIIPLDSDFMDENLGLSQEEYKKVTDDIDLVIHTAACVKHYGEADYFRKVNVDGTDSIAKYCLKNNKKLMHISTISVSGNSFEIIKSNEDLSKKIIFDETCFYQNQDLDNVYVYTKFKAEELILKYMRQGLQANILRIGNLTGRYEDLKFQDNFSENAFSSRIKTFINIGYFPESNKEIYLEFTPVDLCANAIITIMKYFNIKHNMFHIYDNKHVYVTRFIEILKTLGINIEFVDDEKFKQKIEDIANSDNKEILNGIINDLSEDSMLSYKTPVEVKSKYTCDYLKAIGFEWKEIDDRYVISYINYLRKVGFLDK